MNINKKPKIIEVKKKIQKRKFRSEKPDLTLDKYKPFEEQQVNQ